MKILVRRILNNRIEYSRLVILRAMYWFMMAGITGGVSRALTGIMENVTGTERNVCIAKRM